MGVLRRNNVHVLGESGPILMYAHGFGCNQEMWKKITPAFADTHRQILFDYVGCGRSDTAAFDTGRYASLHGYALDILEICDALHLDERITLVGHSVSGSIALLASIARPERFERLVLIGPSPCFLNHPPDYMGGFEQTDLEGLLNLMDQNYIGWAQSLAPTASGEAHGQTDAEPVSQALTTSFCTTDPTLAKVFARATFFSDHRADLPRVTHPSLIIQHHDDALVPLDVGHYMHAHLRNSTLKILNVTGHCAHMSHPDLVVDAMQEYLSAISPLGLAPA